MFVAPDDVTRCKSQSANPNPSQMKCLEGKDDTFGSRLGSSVIYNPMTRQELESLLKEHNLLGSRFQRPYLFFPELLDKLYFEMERALDHPLKVLSCVFVQECLFQHLRFIALSLSGVLSVLS